MAYDDAMFLADNGINVQCQKNTSGKRFQMLDVELCLNDTISYINKASGFHQEGRLRDAIIFWQIAFHLTKIIEEVELSYQNATHLLAGQYALFRVILSQRYVLKKESRKELAQFEPVKHPNARPIKMPLPPTDQTSTRDEAMRAVLSCEITRPNVPAAAIVGQTVPWKVHERNLVLPYTQSEAVNNDKIKRGVLLYGPPGNGKVDQCINHLLSQML